MNFQSYFDAELRSLQQANSENHDLDPSADRILEGVAYLTAKIRERLDDDFPEIPARLIQQHWPYLLQAYASRTILEFSSSHQTILSKGTVVDSPPVGEEKTICKFSMLDDLVVYPIELIELDINISALKFYFEAKQTNLKFNKIKLYLHTDMNTALELYYALGQGTDIKTNTAVWLDYFGFREKYLFIALNDLTKYNNNKYFEVSLPIKHPLPAGIEIKKEYFKLNCIPAVNEYSTQSEPILYKSHQLDYAIVPDKSRPESIVLQSIQTIPAEYVWDFSYSRLMIQGKSLDNNAVLSCDITATNGHYPHQYIREGMMKNLIRPTPYLLPPTQKEYLWKLMSLLNINIHPLDLKNILTLFNWTDKKAYSKQIESILGFEHKPINKVMRGVFYQGTEFTLRVKEEGFRNSAEIYFLGCLLHAFLKSVSPINFLIHLSIELCPSSKTLVF